MEYKFRGRRSDGTWLYGDRVRRGNTVYIFPEDGLDSPDCYEVDPATVGMFTGRYDDSSWDDLTLEEQAAWVQHSKAAEWQGREIYPGDNITHSSRNGGKPHPIVYSLKHAGFMGDYGIKYDFAQELSNDTIKVVGNIHYKKS